jgi:LDH2 family malate/lactate/ureidoglycolate dehydrogenase
LNLDQVKQFAKNAFLAAGEDPEAAQKYSDLVAAANMNGKMFAQCGVKHFQQIGILPSFRAERLLG